jgi:hypothetical protein
MTHIAMQELLDGKNVEWLEKLSGEQYTDGQSTEGGLGIGRRGCAVNGTRAAPIALEKHDEVWHFVRLHSPGGSG